MSESMATGWYYLNRPAGADQQVGPLTWEQLYRFAAAGTLRPSDLVWHPALPQWTPAAQISGLIPAPTPPAPPVPLIVAPVAEARFAAPAPRYAGCAPAPAPGYAGPTAYGAECVLAVAGNLVQSEGFMGMKQQAYSLIFTHHRIIFAQLTKERMSALLDQARDEAKVQGKGFFGQWGAQLGASGRYHEAYLHMPPHAALAETPGNFAIDRATIEKVKFQRGGFDQDNHPSPDYVTIKTSAAKFKLRVGGSLSEVQEAFRDAGVC